MPIYIEDLTTEVTIREPEASDSPSDAGKRIAQITRILAERERRGGFRKMATRLRTTCRRPLGEDAAWR